ncbi:MAG TPA: hypothetical protein IAD23_07630 [Candidatus Scubalenecus merdavium]|uniref:Uncharacterized protein n=1 Tax=Candidatus Scybalenecus merdavium TaxID=2840939 RepID=A0A9D1MW71_9FIRM|nr:hypothetical protein [Candidatus Scubalenecus merdavium]
MRHYAESSRSAGQDAGRKRLTPPAQVTQEAAFDFYKSSLLFLPVSSLAARLFETHSRDSRAVFHDNVKIMLNNCSFAYFLQIYNNYL